MMKRNTYKLQKYEIHDTRSRLLMLQIEKELFI